MFHLADVLQPNPNEKVEALVRRRAVTLVPWLVLAGALIVLPFFLWLSLARYGFIGIAGLIISGIAGALVAVRAFWIWDADALIVTSQRLIDVDQRGVWTRIVAEVPLTAVREIRVERASRLAGKRLRILTSATPNEIMAGNVPRPERLKVKIQELSRLEKPPPAVATAVQERDTLQRRIGDLLEQAGESTLQAVEKLLKQPPEA